MMTPRLSLNSVRVRLALWNVGVLAFVLVGLGIIFSVTIRANINAAIDRRLNEKAHHAQRFFDNPSQFHRPSPPAVQETAADSSGEFRPRLFNIQRVSFAAGDIPWDAAGLSRAEQGEEVYATVRADGTDIRVFSLPVVHEGHIAGVVQVGNSMTRTDDFLGRMTRILLYLIPFVLLFAGLGGAFLTDRALRPVREIAQAANRIEAEDLSHRLPVMGHDEFADLAETFNVMLSRLQAGFERQEQAFEQQQRFAADASHELRTPLTIIKANTSLALSGRRTELEYEKTLRAVDTAADRMTRIVQDLLLLARADADQLGYPLVPTSLAEVLNQAVASLHSLDLAPIHLDLPASPLLVRGHADSLVRLFSNLLENAVRHTPSEGRITVTAHAEGNHIVAEVADTGVGISPEHLPHVMERFYRVEAARSRAHGGTGLGLSICRSIVEAHGGSLKIESTAGVGTTVRVTLLSDSSAVVETKNLELHTALAAKK
ncbi:MAG: sensor histidine kinase [Janthinobacterium lividum]